MNSFLGEEEFFEMVSREDSEYPANDVRAPSALKARLYSTLVREQQESGPLLNLADTKEAGHGLCVFEELVRITPAGEKAQSFNCCSVCHARLLAENFQDAPIYWANCPYVGFHKGWSKA